MCSQNNTHLNAQFYNQTFLTSRLAKYHSHILFVDDRFPIIKFLKTFQLKTFSALLFETSRVECTDFCCIVKAARIRNRDFL